MNWLPILKKCAKKITKDALPFYNTPNASITFGKGAGGDQMKKIDLIAEKAIIETLEKNNTSCTLISEETGIKEIGSKPHDFYLTTDPIDGTTNATRGIPFINTSLAISKTPNLQNIQTALVTDLLHNITYTAQKNKGAHKNNKKIQPSTTTTLEEAVVGVDLGTYKTKHIANQLTPVLEKTKHLRHLGANALELCYVADGTTDAFIDLRGKLRVTDIAAAYLIIKEAGAIMLTPQGKEINVPLTPTQKVSFIATANTALYETIKKLLA
jgi:myo-inositol-1(or 4)-monophosphatase